MVYLTLSGFEMTKLLHIEKDDDQAKLKKKSKLNHFIVDSENVQLCLYFAGIIRL